jgi:hypothetical protein
MLSLGAALACVPGISGQGKVKDDLSGRQLTTVVEIRTSSMSNLIMGTIP